ncbi:Aste57867_4656 [Aphanomyces stellatus]|uniref:glucan endo-1,3-beta-D-glucosidase n=1 Tax=Aphanomyces stellatus TaxID=120398 RepID=A0A485KGS8_9STRA|nr:hypothetical protein As57867_004643 [Aphanomyces stellatus]VFT81759.1 Aste57867_4656 [Aphanomyces stellatus]
MFRLTSLLALAAAAFSLDFQLYGLNYNSRQGADWDANKCKTQVQVDADMVKIAALAPRVRIYSLSDCDQGRMVVTAAKKAGLKVWLGMWVTKNTSSIVAEQAALDKMISANLIDENIIGMHVGSENLYRKDLSVDQLLAYFKQIKTYLTSKQITIPLSIADIVDSFVQYPQVLDVVDVIQANSFPFWEPAAIETSMVNFRMKLDNLTVIAKGKKIQISETGWASAGKHVNASVASPENQAAYLLNLYNFATAHKLDVYYFAAFDDAWKLAQLNEPAAVEASFGLYDAKGNLKPLIASLKLAPSSVDADKTNATSAPPVISGGSGSTNAGASSTTAAPAASSASAIGVSVAAGLALVTLLA